MQGVNTWLEQRPEVHKWQPASKKVQNSRLETVKQHNKDLKLHIIPLSLNKSSSTQLVPLKSQNSLTEVDENSSQVKYYLSLINDPLWKKVCRHVENMMGPLCAIKIWECKLGSFSSEENNIEINCKTEEAAQFLKKYAFVVLGGLKQYFPALKKLKVNCESSFR
jgi:hypothetical protein